MAAAEAGLRTGGDARNRDYVAGHVEAEADGAAVAAGFDPQTSSGLLAAVEPSAVGALVAAGFVSVGQVVAGRPMVCLR